jgi:hypothetical protein
MGHNPARKRIGPVKSATRSISKGILSNSTTDFDKIRAKRCSAMPKDKFLNQLNLVASGGITISGQGKIQI